MTLEIVRRCRICGCTDGRACPGGCAWAFEEVCTSCVGHTPASWAAFRHEPIDEEAMPPLVRLISSMHHAAEAASIIGAHVAHVSCRADLDRRPPSRELAAALLDLLGAAPDLDPPEVALIEELTAFLYGQDEPDPGVEAAANDPEALAHVA